MTQQDKDRAAFEALVVDLSTSESEVARVAWDAALAHARQQRGEPVAYCDACQKVGMRNCSDFVNCGNARCVTCKQLLSAPQPAEQPAASVKEIRPSDLVITTYHPVQVGSWSIRQPHGVRIVHRPTGLMAECHEGRSQHRNRAIAMERLAAAVQAEPVKGRHPMDATCTPKVHRNIEPAKDTKPRPEFLSLAEKCGAILTGKPDGSEPITVVFTIQAWRDFDAKLAEPVKGEPSVPPYLSEILKEAAAIIKGIHPEFRPPTMRQPIIDELETLAAMFNVNEVKRKDAET